MQQSVYAVVDGDSGTYKEDTACGYKPPDKLLLTSSKGKFTGWTNATSANTYPQQGLV